MKIYFSKLKSVNVICNVIFLPTEHQEFTRTEMPVHSRIDCFDFFFESLRESIPLIWISHKLLHAVQ